MGAQGTAIVDFGAFPGKMDASVAVTGQAGIVAGSLVEAWIRPVATADHTVDEHMAETLKVFAADIVAGTGFTIYAFNTNMVSETDVVFGRILDTKRSKVPGMDLKQPKIYGAWTIAWVWN